MAIRSTLGASRSRLIAQLLTENVLLALMGAALGLLVAQGLMRAVRDLAASAVPRLNEVALDGRVLAFTATTALVSGILFGLVPALHPLRSGVNESLKEGGRSGRGVRGRVLHKVLVVAEVSLALVLLVGSGLLIRSLSRLLSVNPGFDPKDIVTAPLSLPAQRYPDPARVTAFCQELLQKVEDIPGAESAALSKSLPPNLLDYENPFYLPGEHPDRDELPKFAEEIPVSASYFQTLGVPLLRGRTFVDADRASRVLIVNRTLAERYFPGQDPVGKQLFTGEPPPKTSPWTIVGEVGDVKYEGLDSAKSPTLYVPYFDERWSPLFARHMYLVVRTAGKEPQIVRAMRSAVWSIDTSLPVDGIRTMDDLLTASVASNQFRATLFGMFAGLALALAAIGIYGVLAFVVAERRHEIGIRMALGAQRTDVLRLLLSEGAKMAAAGIAFGVVASLALSRAMSGLLFSVKPTDPAIFVGVAILLFAVALAACYIPARRAMRVDPMVSLRYE